MSITIELQLAVRPLRNEEKYAIVPLSRVARLILNYQEVQHHALPSFSPQPNVSP